MHNQISTPTINDVSNPSGDGTICAARTRCKPSKRRRQSDGLELGTQARMLALGQAAEALGTPLRHHLTVRLDGLALSDADGALSGRHPATAVRHLLGLLRLWHANRGLPWVAIWARESSGAQGEHLHMALHLPAEREHALLEALERWTGEASDGKRRKPSSPLVGRSECRNWDLRRDTRQEPGNPRLMAYLAKAEPNRIKRRGRWRANPSKAEPRYNRPGGRIEGSTHQDYRWGITRGSLGPRALARAGLTFPQR